MLIAFLRKHLQATKAGAVASRQQDLAGYYQIIKAGETATERDADRLLSLAGRLGFAAARVEADAQLRQGIAAAEAAAANLPARQEALEAADGELAKATAALDAARCEYGKINLARSAALDAVQAAQEGRRLLGEYRRDHAHLCTITE